MTPGPNLQEMIATVRAGAPGDNDLEQLATAVRIVAELEEVSDATLAHFVEQCRSNGRSWSDISKGLGVTKQAAHKRFSFVAPTALERFTPRARAALRTAADKARALGHGYVGTEHLLLSLCEPPGALAAQVLAEAGITRAEVERRIVDASARGSSVVDAEPPFTPRAAESVERAAAEARQLGHNYVGTEHLLLALFADAGSLAASILAESSATYDDFRARVVEKLSANRRPKR